MAKTITTSNAAFLIAIPGFLDAPVPLSNFAADDIFDTENLQATENMVGVDGILSAGLVLNPVVQNISLMASSESGFVFDDWNQAMRIAGDVLYANATIILSSIGSKYACTKGILGSFPPIPRAAKVLQPRRFMITWESVVRQNI